MSYLVALINIMALIFFSLVICIHAYKITAIYLCIYVEVKDSEPINAFAIINEDK